MSPSAVFVKALNCCISGINPNNRPQLIHCVFEKYKVFPHWHVNFFNKKSLLERVIRSNTRSLLSISCFTTLTQCLILIQRYTLACDQLTGNNQSTPTIFEFNVPVFSIIAFSFIIADQDRLLIQKYYAKQLTLFKNKKRSHITFAHDRVFSFVSNLIASQNHQITSDKC